MPTSPTIATVSSHSALQIMKGAKDEGFNTLLICDKKREKFYKRFNLVDEFLLVDEFKDILDEKIQKQLNDKNCVLIPHGSFVEYIGGRETMRVNVPMFGNKKVLEWEADRRKSYEWFKKAGIKVPHSFLKPDEIDRLTLVKLFGAKGGRGYSLVKSSEEFKEKVGHFDSEKMQLQEYILGTRFYPHFFYSPLTGENELTGIDLRYESNADGLPRMPADFYMAPTYVVTGNFPITMRESLLPDVFEIADKLTETSKKLFPPGLTGPYSLEMVCNDKLELYVFEISARIVAGTNVGIPGSPYSYLKYGKEMSMGRRIAMEIKKAISENRLDDVVS
ncbi:TPA: formate--phosphoribosylaminoimidazolecarboxamide ligase [archaeon]|nr:formate--phosphoribosylaminoimidazolecarboxamide ligase [Candidatus Naiadarchaeales archaeon SRR2090153.bin461]